MEYSQIMRMANLHTCNNDIGTVTCMVISHQQNTHVIGASPLDKAILGKSSQSLFRHAYENHAKGRATYCMCIIFTCTCRCILYLASKNQEQEVVCVHTGLRFLTLKRSSDNKIEHVCSTTVLKHHIWSPHHNGAYRYDVVYIYTIYRLDPLQLHVRHKIGKFLDISIIYGHSPTTILVYHLHTHLWLFLLTAIGEHCFLSSCPLATRGQNKQWPTLIFIWN